MIFINRTMNEIERILHKYFSDEELEYRALTSMIDNPVWMENHGYKRLVQVGSFGMDRELTPEGKKFIQESEKKISKLVDKIMNKCASIDDKTRAMREIKSYLWSHPDVDIEKELSEKLYYAYLSLLPDY